MEWRSTVEEFLQHLKIERHSQANTISAYQNDLFQFADYLARNLPPEANWSQVQADTLNDYVESLAGRYTTSTTARKIAALKTLFQWLNQRGFVLENGAGQLKSPKVEKRAPRILSEEEVARLMDATANVPAPRSLRDRALLELIYSTGLRVTEAIMLKLSEIDLEKGEVHCPGKGSRQRSAPLTTRAVAALREYMEHARSEMMSVPASAMVNGREDVYIFLNPQGRNLTRQAVWLMTRQYARGAHIEGEVTPHTLRHSRAAHMLKNGEDVKRVREWFGHANLATTQMYQAKSDDPITKLAIISPTSNYP